jgi:hypothetical protein
MSEHAYTPENTYVSKSGWRECRACQRIRISARRADPRYLERELAYLTPERRASKIKQVHDRRANDPEYREHFKSLARASRRRAAERVARATG